MFNYLSAIWRKIVKPKPNLVAFPEIFEHFQELLQDHQRVMELIADLGERSGGEYIFDRKYLVDTTEAIQTLLLQMVKGLNLITANRYLGLYSTLDHIFIPMEAELRGTPKPIPGDASGDRAQEATLDRPELTGGKANNLVVIMRNLHLPVPSGFVITTRAYRRFWSLTTWKSAFMPCWKPGSQEKWTSAKPPARSNTASWRGWSPRRWPRRCGARRKRAGIIGPSAAALSGKMGSCPSPGSTRVSSRSRAGSSTSRIKRCWPVFIPRKPWSTANGWGCWEESAMAVLGQQMIPSRVSGVIHTLDVSGAESDCLVIFAYWGLGRTVVEGRARADRYVVDRDYPHHLRVQEIVRKENLLRPMSGGGEEEAPVDPEEQSRATLGEETISTLGRWALSLERYFKRPQEIEWAMDQEGNCWILQSRGLAFLKPAVPPLGDICETCARYPVLIQDTGVVAHAGVGSGPVAVVQADEEMNRFPEGAVLVTKYTAPWLARIVPKAAAIVAERGSAVGHLATIAL